MAMTETTNPLRSSMLSSAGRNTKTRESLMAGLKQLFRLMPSSLPEFIYTVILKPKPLKNLVNRFILKIIPEQVSVQGVNVALNKRDPVISAALMLGVYETAETQFVMDKIKPGMRVLDIGANVGYYTALFSKLTGPTGEVIAFEPEPGNYEYLKQTIQLNGFAQAKPVNAAVAQEPGTTFLYLSDSNQGDHRIYNADASVETAKVSVPVVSIDTLVDSSKPVDFIKMDVQGAEGQVLSGMRETIRRSPSVMLLMEFWPEGLTNAGTSPLEMLQILHEELGLEIWNMSGEQKSPEKVTDFAAFIARHSGRKYANLFCRRSEDRADVKNLGPALTASILNRRAA